jgi:hypothetical protein
MTGHVCSPSWQILVEYGQRRVPVMTQNGRNCGVKHNVFLRKHHVFFAYRCCFFVYKSNFTKWWWNLIGWCPIKFHHHFVKFDLYTKKQHLYAKNTWCLRKNTLCLTPQFLPFWVITGTRRCPYSTRICQDGEQTCPVISWLRKPPETFV